MEVKDRITKAKISLQRSYPFWAYLSLFLKFKESEDLPDYAGMGVDERRNLYYKKEFIEELSDQELVGVIAHEINHLVFLHLLRRNNRHPEIWNIACDICVNSLLERNNFKLPKDCLLPDYHNEIELFGIKIKDCNKKIAEKIYDEIEKKAKKQMKGKCACGKCECDKDKNGKRKGNGECKCGKCECKGELFKGRFDEHFEGKNLTPKEKKEIEDNWNGKVQEALTIAKMKGDMPVGLERLIGKLHENKVNWKTLLQRYITNQIPYNHSYRTPHKKSISTGYYMPNTLKEKISIVIAIDVSGSIGQQELIDFLSEIIGMARAFQDRIEMTLITHETDVNNIFQVRNGSIDEIKKLKIEGGGGTAHDKVFNHIQEKIRDCKCVVFLTDGYSDLNEINFDEYAFNKIFVISDGGTDDQLKDKNCHTINLKEK